MFKLLAVSGFAYVATAFPHFRKQHIEVKEQTAAAWPDVNLFTTFKSDISLHQWDGSKLKPFKDITATAMLDSERNKIRLDAKVQIPLIGHAAAVIVLDLNVDAPAVYEHVPLLKLCQK